MRGFGMAWGRRVSFVSQKQRVVVCGGVGSVTGAGRAVSLRACCSGGWGLPGRRRRPPRWGLRTRGGGGRGRGPADTPRPRAPGPPCGAFWEAGPRPPQGQPGSGGGVGALEMVAFPSGFLLTCGGLGSVTAPRGPHRLTALRASSRGEFYPHRPGRGAGVTSSPDRRRSPPRVGPGRPTCCQ